MTTPWGGGVFFQETTSSTMDDARELESRGEPDGSVAQAGYQTSGRGRHAGRVWQAAPGQNLLFTVFWNPKRFLVSRFAPSLTVGLGVCLWLEGLALDAAFPVRLKWPNDVYLGDRKVAGILVRQQWGASGGGSIHAGIGINLVPAEDASAYRTPPISVAEVGLLLKPEVALRGVLDGLAEALQCADPRAECEARLWRLAATMELSTPDADGHLRRGLVRGLDEQGRLIWDGPLGVETLSSAE